MPKWSSDADTGFLQSLQAMPAAIPTELPKVGGVFEKSQLGAGLADKIKEAAEKAKTRGDRKGTGDQLQVDELAGFSGLRVSDPKLGFAADRLDEARVLIKQGKFQEALRIVEEVLQEKSGHPTALYLKGLCECRLDRAEAALRTIAPVIRSTPVSLDSQMRQLRTEIREKMAGEVAATVLKFCVEGRVEAGLRRIYELLDLDPAVPVYHFLRIHVLLAGDQIAEASAAAEAANPYCHGSDKEMLDGMRHEIRRRMLVAALEPARYQYRAMNWKKARKAIDRIRSEWGHEALWQVFQQYLEALGGGFLSKGRRPEDVRPTGDFRTVDQLHFLLVREELENAKALLATAQPQQAVDVLQAGYRLTPHFPYLQYMLGQAIYLTILLHFATGDLPPIETVDEQLQEAHRFATYGAQDNEIESAKNLIDAIEVAQQAMEEVRAEQKKQECDAGLIRPLGDQFIAIMEGAKNGIESVEHYHDLRKRLRKIRSDIPAVRGKLGTDGGRTSLKQLETALDRNIDQLDKMEPEMKTAGEIVEFQKRLKSIMDTGRAAGNLSKVQNDLRDLKTQADAYKRRHSLAADAKQAVDALIADIGNIEGGLAEAALVNPLIKKFETAFAPLKDRTRPLEFVEAFQMRTSMSAIVTEGTELLRRLRKPEARKSIEQVVSVARDIVQKIQL